MKWKKLWFGLGGVVLSGLALGSTVSVARKNSAPLPAPWWIPDPPTLFSILTEEMEWGQEDKRIRAYLEYACLPTQFELWNLLDLDLYRVRRETGPAMRSLPIFYVAMRMHLEGPEQELPPVEDERFYATIHTHRGKTATTLANCVQVGRYVEFRKCSVGGALNGIETGERIVSMAPVREVQPR